jgi:hypothetical protein
MLSVRRGPEAVAFYKIENGGSVVAQLAVQGAKFWVAAGARQIWPVRNENGWFMGRVVDPFGHHWEIGKPLGPGVGE